MIKTITDIIHKVPSSEDIDVLERRLETMKKQREEAKNTVVSNLTNLVDQEFLPYSDLIKIQKIISSRLAAGHVKRRGNRVPDKLRDSLDAAIKLNEFSLSQMAKMFNLSVSYIARRKNALGLTGKTGPKEQVQEPKSA